MAIETFTDDELNYNAGDRILITGVTVTTGPTLGGEEFLLDSTLINGLREVDESVPAVEYSYLVVLLPDVILDAYGAGLIAGGASWVPPELSRHGFTTHQEGSDVLMEVAGRLNGSYQDLGYSIGDYIRIGGVTETIGDLQPDDVNGVHEIVKFGETALMNTVTLGTHSL